MINFTQTTIQNWFIYVFVSLILQSYLKPRSHALAVLLQLICRRRRRNNTSNICSRLTHLKECLFFCSEIMQQRETHKSTGENFSKFAQVSWPLQLHNGKIIKYYFIIISLVNVKQFHKSRKANVKTLTRRIIKKYNESEIYMTFNFVNKIAA